ncbi:MAG: acyl-CoA thioesterase domain-containing protein, partial [Croceibacterium sp.]
MSKPPALADNPEQLVAELALLLDLEAKGGDRFIGRRQMEGTGRVFGGQAIAQALVAARRTVPDDRHTHSLHAYFLRSGSDAMP